MFKESAASALIFSMAKCREVPEMQVHLSSTIVLSKH